MNTKNTFLIIAVFLTAFYQNAIAQVTTSEEKNEITIKPEIKVGGRIQYDFEFLKEKDGLGVGQDYTLNGQEFRAVYLNAEGSLTKNIKFKAEMDFAGSKIGFRDMYIKFVDIPVVGGNFIIGSQAQPSSMEDLTSGNFVLFKEKTPLSATSNFRWTSGFGYENFGLLKGKLGFQMTYGFNGKNTEGFVDADIENGSHFTARLSSPVFEKKEKHQLIHFGVNFESRKYTKNPANYSLKFRPENHMGYQITVPFTSLEKQLDYGFEFAAILGPITIQSEYENAGYKTLAKDYNVNSYYALVSYFLTGDHRSYKNGVFGRVSPYKNFSFEDKTFGALEVLARFSNMDYSDVITIGNNDKVKSIALGLNWYFNSHSRLMYNYVTSDFNKTGDNNRLNQHLFRVQLDF